MGHFSSKEGKNAPAARKRLSSDVRERDLLRELRELSGPAARAAPSEEDQLNAASERPRTRKTRRSS
jgi:hypothetical protein